MNDVDPLEEVIFNAARQLGNPDKCRQYLDLACEGRPELRHRIERLLRTSDEADAFFGRTATFTESVAAPVKELAGAPVRAPTLEQSGTRIGRYKLLEQIGEGGFGVVFMAEQEEPVRRRVALKLIKLGMDTKQVLARFEAERQALALMDHPNIARVLDGGATENGRPYFVMELVQGVPITEFCDKNQLSVEQRLKLFIPICQAIQSAHQKGIIHRDLKPTNILVTLNPDGSGFPKVIDFGVAKATDQKLTEKTLFTAHGMMVGTPAYMSPEQAEMSRLDVDTRADIYSLGALLYELLTGSPPFPEQRLRSAGYNEMQRIILEEQPERPSMRLSTLRGEQRSVIARNRGATELTLGRAFPGDLDWIVMKCLEKDRARRYETANGLAQDLERHLKNEPVVARPPSRLYEFQKTLRRHWVGFSAVAGIVVALSVGVVVSTLQTARARRAETLAKQRLSESQTVSRFMFDVFGNADPAKDGRTITVAESLGLAAKRLEEGLTTQPAIQAKLEDTLAWTYHQLGLNQEAIPLGEKARDYCLAAYGLSNSETLRMMNNLAIYYDQVGRADDAFKLKQQVLELRRKTLGPEHPDTLQSMNNLANAYGQAGRLEEARRLLEDVLALRRKVSGVEDPETLLVMRNLGNTYYLMGRYDEALKLWQLLLPLRRKVSGPENPETLWAMEGLATSLFGADRLDEALKLREEVLTNRLKVLGLEHRATLMAMCNLANSYRAAGRPDEALNLLNRALPLQRKVAGPERFDTLNTMNSIAIILATSDDPKLRNGTNAVSLAEAAVTGTHRRTSAFLNTLAAAYAEAGQFDKAVAAQQEAISLARNEKEKKDLESALRLYQSHKPLREHWEPD